MPTDAELLQRYAKEKSEPAFAELVQRHLTLVYSAALRLLGGDTHLAQDVTQNVFTALARKASSLTNRAALAGWLYLSTHHAAAQVVRSSRRRQLREQEAQAMHELFSSATPPTDWDRVRPVLDEVMRELSDSDREAVLLRYFERRPFAEIGAALHLSDDAARMRVERALDKLRLLLEHRGITSTVAALAAVFANQGMVAAPAGFAATVTTTAVAGAAATATGFFMSSTLVIISAVAIAAVGSATYEFNAAHHARAAAAAVSTERDGLRAQLRELQQRSTQSNQQVAALQNDIDALRAPKAAAQTPGKPSTPTMANVESTAKRADEQAVLVRVKEEVEKRRINRVQALDREYSMLYRQLGFNEGQISQFKSLMTANINRRDEIGKLASAQGLKASDPAMRALSDQAEGEFRAKMQATFGDAAFQSVQHFDETAPLRNVARELAANFFYSDTPLSPTQANQLVEIMWNSMRNAQGKFDSAAVNFEVLMAQAQTMLTAPQLEFLRQSIRIPAANGPERRAN